MKNENNYDFRQRHWQIHQPGRRDESRCALADEVMIDGSWSIGCYENAALTAHKAVRDFQDYLFVSMGAALPLTSAPGSKVIFIEEDHSLDKGFVLDVSAGKITIRCATRRDMLPATIHMEDLMNLAAAPVLKTGTHRLRPMYRRKEIHSGCGIDSYPDEELMALLHAGYNTIAVFVQDFDRNRIGYLDINAIIERADSFGIETVLFNYIQTWIHPDDSNAQEVFDSVYGELFRRYPKAVALHLCGESLQFPSKDPHTNGKHHTQCTVDGIPDTRPCPGWYPCYDYPAYLKGIRDAVYNVKPDAELIFSTYNWGYAPFELRKKFLKSLPEGYGLNVCYEIFSKRKLENLHTPVMDYTISATEPGDYFLTETRAAHELGIKLTGNVNTAGVAWDFGCVPYVPVPYRWLRRSRNLRKAKTECGVDAHYATHHYGWWQCVAADIAKWASWEDFEPDYDKLLADIAIRDYGKEAAAHVLNAWKFWSDAMDHYTASNEDQYGPWRVGAAYPFIFHPEISRTMVDKNIDFPTAKHAHFGGGIVKTFYRPFENAEQSPGFLRFPAELRSLAKMLDLWNRGLAEVQCAITKAAQEKQFKQDNIACLEALGHFIRNSIRTTMNIKKWWLANMALQTSADAATALKHLDNIENIAQNEIGNVKDTIPVVEKDSRLGWEPSMEYVCDKWHLEWKLRQINSALSEVAEYRKMLLL